MITKYIIYIHKYDIEYTTTVVVVRRLEYICRAASPKNTYILLYCKYNTRSYYYHIYFRCVHNQYIRPWMKKEQQVVSQKLHDAADKAAGVVAHAHMPHLP